MADAAPTVELRLAACPGGLQADGRLLPIAPRDAALLAWLAIEGPTSRTRIAQLLWPDSEPESARNTLRQRLFQLKKQFAAELVKGQALLSLASGVSHDLDGSDDVLGGVAVEIGAEFTDWLGRQRQRRRQRIRQSLAELADMAEQACDWDDALMHARDVLAMDPLSEDAHRRVIRLHYLSGDRSAALLAFDHCEHLLKHEVGATPAAETLQLLRLVEAGSRSAGSATRARALPASLRRPPRDVGRARERRDLMAAWEAGQPVLLVGESGIGKSRLLDALVSTWPGTLLVRARPGDAAVPLALVARLIEALGEQQPAWRVLPAATELRTLLAGLPAPSQEGTAMRPVPRPLRPLLAEALAGLDAASTALLFDDWQFADNASVELLEEVLDAARPASVRWGIASRSGSGEQAERRLSRLRERSDLRVVMLEALDAASATELIDSLEIGASDAAGLAAALVQRIGGNPLFLLEAVRHMLELGVPLLPQYVSVPRQVRDMVARRLGQLPERARQLLYAAAIAEGDFSVALAEAVTGRHALELSESWARLELQGLFGAQGIVHDVYAESALAHLPEPIARALHGRVAEFLEARPHEPARLAAHWRAAGRDERAAAPLLAAARKAWNAARADDTFALFEQAADIAAASGREAEAFDLWFDNADAMTEIGSPALARRCLERLRHFARSEAHELRVRLVAAVVRAAAGEVEAGLSEVTGLLGDAIALGDGRVESECRFAIANRAAADGRFDDALQHLAAGERLMRDAGDLRRAAGLTATMALVLGLRGQPRVALREQQRMLPLLAAENDQATWTVVCSAQAVQHMRQGHADAALRVVRQARDAAARTSIAPRDTSIVLRNLVDALRWSEHLGEALQVCDEFGARLSQQGDFPRAREPIAALYLLLGRADLATPLVEALALSPPARSRERWRLLLLQWQLRLSASEPVASGAAHEPAEVLAGEDLALAAEWALWSGLLASSPWPIESLQALTERCGRAGLELMEPPLQALLAWRLAQAGAADANDAASSLPAGRHAALPWTALYAALALERTDRREAARDTAVAGLGWLHDTARHGLGAPFRDAYLQRNPVHRALASVAARLAR